MKPVKSSIAAIAIVLSTASLGGCVSMWNDDGHQMTQSVYRTDRDQAFWSDRQWRQDITRDWNAIDRELSRKRLAEFID